MKTKVKHSIVLEEKNKLVPVRLKNTVKIFPKNVTRYVQYFGQRVQKVRKL